ncbi:Major Facilitator Superfamily protein [Mesorhizobium sp. NFR06]|nr:Major Facilitator Superfamily protein [Mesorhizobium sp. NFR06]
MASFRTLAEVLKRPMIRIALLVVLLVASGQFAGFTYVRPFLETVPVMPIETISLVLLAYGIGGFFGNFAGAFLAERNLKMAVGLAPLLIALSAAALLVFGASPITAAIAVTAWGFAFGAVPVGLQTWLVRAAPDQAESAGGLMVATFQVAIALGAIVGGLLVDHAGVATAFAYGGVATLLAALVAFLRGPEQAAE